MRRDLRSPARGLVVALVLLAVTASACACGREVSALPPQLGGSVPQSHGGPVRDHVSFVDALRAAGYAVSIAGRIRQPFLRPLGVVLQVGGPDLRGPAELQSFDYDDRDLGTDGLAAAQADAAQLQPDGQPRTAGVPWAGPPHLFRRERVLVIYVGDDPAVLRQLEGLLGPQFAGR
jgi:hypothetical protein